MYNLTAQIQLQAPNNAQAARVVNQINRQLQGVAVDVRVNANNRQIAQTAQQINSVSKSSKNAARQVNTLGQALGTATRRFGSVAIITGGFLALTRGIKDALKEAISFEREVIRISQVTGNTTRELRGLVSEVTNLSTSLGVSSKDILTTARTLSQAGFAADEVTRALKILSQTTLAPTFDNIADTTEGAIALLNQFKDEAAATGDEILFLENSLGAINEVSKRFAVESADLISVIRRTGGVFESAGGSLNELLALFTSVRSTTRESADTIATGFRTIFTRIQRVDTIENLKALGIELQDAEGKFVGPLEAIRRLSIGLSALDPRDYRFNQIVEDLGGFRQIGKVIPLIKQFRVSTEALAAAQEGQNSVAEDAEKAQQSLEVRLDKVREKFSALFREILDSKGFNQLVDIAINLAEALIKVGDALIPLIPLLTTFIGIKIGSSLTGFSKGLLGRNSGGPIGFASGGPVLGFNNGGLVPGVGNRDTVPAMLSAGEYVIKKKSVESIGAENLAALNAGGSVQKFGKGGKVVLDPGAIGGFFLRPAKGEDRDFQIPKGKKIQITNPSVLGVDPSRVTKDDLNTYVNSLTAEEQFERGLTSNKRQKIKPGVSGEKSLTSTNNKTELARESLARDIQSGKGAVKGKKYDISGVIQGFFAGGEELENQSKVGNIVSQQTESGMRKMISDISESIKEFIDIPPIDGNENVFESSISNLFSAGGAKETVEGYMLEGVISALTNANLAGSTASFDFPSTSFSPKNRQRLSALFGAEQEVNKLVKADAKRTGNSSNYQDIINKLQRDINKGNTEGVSFFNDGGSPKDNVPAMLTSGEYVFNSKAADRIGRANLDEMNRKGVIGFNKGGAVGNVRKFNGGGNVGVSTSQFPDISSKVIGLAKQLDAAGISVEKINKILPTFSQSLQEGDDDFTALSKSVEELGGDVKDLSTGISSSAQSAKSQKDAALKEVNARAASTEKAFNAAQNFVFLAGSISLVASQLGIFSDEVAEGVTAGIGQFTALIGIIGTVGPIFLSLGTTLAASAIPAAAALGTTILTVLGPIGLLAAGVALLVSVVSGFRSAAAAARDKLDDLAAAEVGNLGKEDKSADINIPKSVIEGAFFGNGATFENSVGNTGQANQAVLDFNKEKIEEFNRTIANGGMVSKRTYEAREKDIKQLEELKAQQEAAGKALGFLTEPIDASNIKEVEKNIALFNEALKNAPEDQKGLDTLNEISKETATRLDEARASIERSIQSQQSSITEFVTRIASTGGGLEGALSGGLQEKLDDLRNNIESTSSSQEEANKRYKEATDSIFEAGRAAENYYAAQQQLINSATRLSAALNAVSDISRAVAESEITTSNTIGAREGNADVLDLGFEGFSEVGDLNAFNDNVDLIVGGLGTLGQEIGDRAKSTAENLKELDDSFFDAIATSGLENISKTVAEELKGAPQEFIDKVTEQVKGIDVTKFQEFAFSNEARKSFSDGIAKLLGEADQALLKGLAEAKNSLIDQLVSFGDAIREIDNNILSLELSGAETRQNREAQIIEASGGRLTSTRADFNQFERIFARSQEADVNRTDINSLLQGALSSQRESVKLSNQAQGQEAFTAQETINESREQARQAGILTDALKDLADQSEIASAVLSDIDFEKSKIEAFTSALDDFTFATNQGRQDIQTNFAALNTTLATGSIESIPDQFRPVVGQLLDQFKDVELAGGLTGQQIKGEFRAQTLERLLGRRLSGQERQRVREGTSSEVERLINKLDDIRQSEIQANQALIQIEEDQRKRLVDGQLALQQNFYTNLNQILNNYLQKQNQQNQNQAGQQVAVGGNVDISGEVNLSQDTRERLVSEVSDTVLAALGKGGGRDSKTPSAVEPRLGQSGFVQA